MPYIPWLYGGPKEPGTDIKVIELKTSIYQNFQNLRVGTPRRPWNAPAEMVQHSAYLVNYSAYCQVIPALHCVQTYQNLLKTYQNHAEMLPDSWDTFTHILQCTQLIATRTILCDYYNSIFYIDLVQVNSFKCNF